MSEPPDHELADLIDRFGWSVMLVHGDTPFGYTIGVSKTFHKPELFIAGLSLEDIHNICNRYGEQVREGHEFRPGDSVSDWLEAGDMVLIEVEDQWKPMFMGKAVDDFGMIPALQAVWPIEGKYPWDPSWPVRLKGAQFLLGSSPGS